MIDLTERELLVLMLLAEGAGILEICSEIERGKDTTKHCISDIKWKLNAKNSAHAVALAYHHGILKPRAIV